MREGSTEGGSGAALGGGAGSPAAVEVTHYLGGPCDPDQIVTCVVPGGVRRGWSVVTRAAGGLEAAIHLAHTRAARRCEGQGEVAGGGADATHSRFI